MVSVEILRELYAYMEWADAQIWSVALKTGAATSDGLLRDKLFHIHRTQRAYLRMWTNQPQESVDPTDFETISVLYRWAQPYYAEARGFLATADSLSLRTPVPPPFRQRMEQHLGPARTTVTVGDTAFDVVSHTTHHRGQINTRLRELDEDPPTVDYVAWVWRGRPVTEWPVEPI